MEFVQCPKCKNSILKQTFTSHYNSCGLFQTQNQIPITTNYLNTTNTTSNINNYILQPQNIPTQTKISQSAPIIYQSNVIPSTTQSFRPQTVTYFPQNTNLYNQNNIYKNTPVNLATFKCNICGRVLKLVEKKDHMLSHKIEQEEKDYLQAKKIQEEDLFNNASQEEINQQRRIEEQIRRQRQNNNIFPNNINTNFGNNSNFMNNDFNIDDDMNFSTNTFTINEPGQPNVIIRRVQRVNNFDNMDNDMGIPNFFQNFFNGNPNMGMGGLQSSNGRFIPIRINFGGNGMGQGNMNDLIEQMLHYNRDHPTDETIVSGLPEKKIDDIKKLDKDKTNCVICLEDFKNGDVTTNLPCLHMFHTDCIRNWLKKQNTCPICKYKLTAENIMNINSGRS